MSRVERIQLNYKLKELEFFYKKINFTSLRNRDENTDILEIIYSSNAFINSFMSVVNYFKGMKGYEESFFIFHESM
ncbi:MAG: hypothetical protein HeimC3_34800 [Candidatus Heimdallarchaeota archaeon LC_3]|nr:MAG: hypothetical protein HeimC3_34800 [Candidatus Heimdallarchaeota archaeon LC_3]